MSATTDQPPAPPPTTSRRWPAASFERFVGRRQGEPAWVRAASLLHGVTLALAGLVLVRVNQGQWFRQDEWDFLASARFDGGLLQTYLTPHNEHWSTAPLLIYRTLFAVFGVRTYWPYVGVLILMHLALAHVLWRVLRRAGTRPLLATTLAALFAVLGAGFEDLVWAFQIGFVGSVLVGWLVVLLVNHAGRWQARDNLAVVLGIVGLTFSGITLTMLVLAAFVILLRRGIRRAVLFSAAPAVVFTVWLATYGRSGLNSHDSLGPGLKILPEYVLDGVTQALQLTTGLPGAGGALALLLVAWVVRHVPVARGPEAPAFAGAFSALVLYVVVGLGRAQLGVEQSGSPRYIYIAIALLLPMAGLALSQLPHDRMAETVLCLAIALSMTYNLQLLRTGANNFRTANRPAQENILAAAILLRTQPTVPGQVPELSAPNLRPRDLAELDRRGDLPRLGALPERAMLTAATNLQFGQSDTPVFPTVQATCRDLTAGGATALVTGPQPQSVPLELTGPATVRVAYVDPATNVWGTPRDLHLFRRHYLLTTRPNAPYTVTVTTGSPLRVCG